MQQIDHWPDMSKITLPELVAQDLQRQLLEPFDSEGEAQEFCQETYSTLIILDHTDSITVLKESEEWNQIEFALTYPG